MFSNGRQRRSNPLCKMHSEVRKPLSVLMGTGTGSPVVLPPNRGLLAIGRRARGKGSKRSVAITHGCRATVSRQLGNAAIYGWFSVRESGLGTGNRRFRTTCPLWIGERRAPPADFPWMAVRLAMPSAPAGTDDRSDSAGRTLCNQADPSR